MKHWLTWVATFHFLATSAFANDTKLLNGLWIDPNANCKAARDAMEFDMGGVWFEGFEEYAIFIRNGFVYGIENTCKIKATKRSRGDILATMTCEGEGMVSKEIARYRLTEPKTLTIGNAFSYKRC